MEDALAAEVAARGRQPNLSFFAHHLDEPDDPTGPRQWRD